MGVQLILLWVLPRRPAFVTYASYCANFEFASKCSSCNHLLHWGNWNELHWSTTHPPLLGLLAIALFTTSSVPALSCSTINHFPHTWCSTSYMYWRSHDPLAQMNVLHKWMSYTHDPLDQMNVLHKWMSTSLGDHIYVSALSHKHYLN